MDSDKNASTFLHTNLSNWIIQRSLGHYENNSFILGINKVIFNHFITLFIIKTFKYEVYVQYFSNIVDVISLLNRVWQSGEFPVPGVSELVSVCRFFYLGILFQYSCSPLTHALPL